MPMRRFGAMLTVLLLCCAFPAHAMTVSVDYEASEAELVNPFIGNAVWANDLSETSQPFTLVYANLRWADFEREEGVFDFDSFEGENNFSFWREQGKHLILRFVMDIPTSKKHRDIPDWLYERTAGDGKAYSTDYGKGYSPNYENPLLIEAHARAIEALGARYDRDSFVAYVELGSLGHWGEWHVHDKAGVMPDEAIREQYVLPYVKAFSNTPLMMRRPFRAAKVYGMGLYNDTSADPDDTEEWLSWIEDGGTYDQTQEQSALVPMANAWQTAPIGGELATDRKETALLAENLEETLSLFSASHSSWIGPRSFAKAVQRGGELQSAYDQLSRLLGYRLRGSRVALTDG
ncbi:MAG: DUF4874 domain-containing protein, partial [Clostridia bacterium]|nr:DUF4874 domain-containing protein [Clostridia bacterium]